jgi:hypothetical protein
MSSWRDSRRGGGEAETGDEGGGAQRGVFQDRA